MFSGNNLKKSEMMTLVFFLLLFSFSCKCNVNLENSNKLTRWQTFVWILTLAVGLCLVLAFVWKFLPGGLLSAHLFAKVSNTYEPNKT